MTKMAHSPEVDRQWKLQRLNSSVDKQKTNNHVDPKRFIEIYIEIKKE